MQKVTSKSGLSLSYDRLIQLMKDDQSIHEKAADLRSDQLIPYMEGYHHNVGQWPVIVSQEIVKEYQHMVRLFPQVVYKAIKLFFKKDMASFGEYLNENPLLLDMLDKHQSLGTKEMFIRFDVVYSSNQIKILETNAGSNTGGWQMDWLSPQIDHVMNGLIETSPLNVQYRNISESFFTAIHELIADRGLQSSGHMFYYDYQEMGTFSLGCGFGDKLKDMFKQSNPVTSSECELKYFSDFDKLQFLADGKLQHEGDDVALIIIPLSKELDIPRHFYYRLVSGNLNAKFIFIDSPIHNLVGNKVLFSLLHEQELWLKFDQEEREFIERYIPWSCKLSQTESVFKKGEVFNLNDMLWIEKDHLVFKKSDSQQGDHVFIGKFQTNEQWKALINQAIDENDWIVQQYCEPDSIEAYHPTFGLHKHDMVHGVFGFGGQYGGTFVRASMNNSNGVINSARGAIEVPAFEESN